MTLLVRDEVDIVRDNIEFHLNSGVDFIVAMDNHSVDGTTDILREFERIGKLQYIYEPSDDYLQDVWVTDLARLAFIKHGANWVINCDADEFFIAQNGTLKDVLKTISPELGAVSVKRHDMVPVVRSSVQSPPIEMVYRKHVSTEWVMGHPIVDKVIHRGVADIEVGRGSHWVRGNLLGSIAPNTDIFTFHYPIRSFDQFSKKVKNVGGGRMKNAQTGSRYDSWYLAQAAGTLSKVYLSYQLDRKQLEEKLASGEIVEDHRLSEILLGIK